MMRILKNAGFFLFVVLIAVGPLFVGCDLDGGENTGIAVFNIYISGYNEDGDKTITLELKHKSTDEETTQEVPLLDDDTSSGYFSGLDSGKYDVTVAFLNDDELVGDHDFEIEIYPDETTRSRIDGVWENGEMTFEVSTVTSGDDGDTSVEIDDMNVVLVEERRYWDEPNSPSQTARLVGEGSFDTVYGCSVTYPDGYEVHLTENLRYLGARVEIGSDWFTISRYNYMDSGVYQVSLFDINDLGDTKTSTIDVDLDGVSSPKISNPSQGGSYASPVAIDWSFSAAGEIKTVFLYVVPTNDTSTWHYANQHDPSITSDSAAGLVAVTSYELLIFAVDKNIPQPFPGEYSSSNLLYTLIADYGDELDYIGLARLQFDVP